ncbi:MAG: DHH family phosphoesterase [Nanoarchaeota archaeon]|jgi:single-stranded-DNA-specific exonuclease|nr:DHH family phosphoesterase [Nanoarchaeota archaeon]
MTEKNILDVKLRYTAQSFLDQIKGEDVIVVSHFDTDGITAGTIMLQVLKKIDQRFSLQIIKSLTKDFIDKLPKNKIILFIDLASGSLGHIRDAGLRKVFIIDHHEVTEEIPENVEIVNPELCEKQKISSSGLIYLFCKEIDKENKEYAKLAILGMIGDQMDQEIDALNHEIIKDGDIQKKRGLLIYPSTRPLNRTLEYSSDPFIPGVTGDVKGVLELLREADLSPEGGKYKALINLTPEEMERLVTSIMLRNPDQKNRQLIGDLFLIKMFGKLEDARELSAKINACSRDGKPHVAISLCMEEVDARKDAESVHVKYKQSLISGIKYAQEINKIEGPGFAIFNAEENIKDTMIGTITSIIANSSMYKKGTIIIGMAKDDQNNMIKISARNVGKEGRHVRELLAQVMEYFEGEVGGHQFAAGCSIPIHQADSFIQKTKEAFDIPTPTTN